MRKTTLLLAGASLAMLSIAPGCSQKQVHKSGPDTITVKAIRLDAAVADGTQQVVYNGTLQASKAIDLSFQVSGTIKSFPFQVGDYVKKGTLIASVDETTYRNQYNAQIAQSKLAEENYKRMLAVFQKGSVAEIKMLEARSNYEQASSMARATYQNIAHTRLYAPQSGYIGEKTTEAGSIANPGQPVVRLLDTRAVEVLVSVPESEINRYKSGDKATVIVDALGNAPMEGRVSEIGVLALNNSANYNLKVKLENPRQELRPGMLCKVTFKPQATKRPKAINEVIVPLEAVQVDEQGKNFVYITGTDNIAYKKEVQTGALYNNGIAITTGLSGTEHLITSGFQKLTDKTPVTLETTNR